MAEQSKKVIDRVRDVAVEDLQQARDVATEAVKSQAYLFPVKGTHFLDTNSTVTNMVQDSITSSRIRHYGALSCQSSHQR